MPTDRRMDKENLVCVYIYNATLLIIKKKKKNKILPFATTWMGLEGTTPSEISQM